VSWGDWSASSESCGPGSRTRNGTVVTPASNGGAACPSLQQVEAFEIRPCVRVTLTSPSDPTVLAESSRLALSSIVSSLNTTTSLIYHWSAVNISSSGQAVAWPTNAIALASARKRLLTSTDKPALVFGPGALTGGSTYIFTLQVTDAYGTNSDSVRPL
jgi:hypothetical protein